MKESIEFLVVVEVESHKPGQRAYEVQNTLELFRLNWRTKVISAAELTIEQSQAIRNVTRTGKEAVSAPQTVEETVGTLKPILGGPDGSWFVADSAP